MFTTPYLCDRRIYDKKGYWKNPNKQNKTTLFYYIKEQPTYVPSYNNGLEELKEQIVIVVFGEHPFTTNDYIEILGRKYLIKEILPNYLEHNILVKDMLKDRIGSMQLTLD